MSVSISPLVLLNISDSVQRGLSKVGALRGFQTDASATISFLNSFELPQNDEVPLIDYVNERNALMAQIYPEEGGLIGFYYISDELEVPVSIAQQFMTQLQVAYVLVFSPKLAVNKDGHYYKVFDAEGHELKFTVSHSGDEAVNTILQLKEADSTETTKSKDMMETQQDVLGILQARVSSLVQALENGDLSQNYDVLRRVHSLVSKLEYKADPDVKKELLDLENTYKLVLATSIAHENTQNLEKSSSGETKVFPAPS